MKTIPVSKKSNNRILQQEALRGDLKGCCFRHFRKFPEVSYRLVRLSELDGKTFFVGILFEV